MTEVVAALQREGSHQINPATASPVTSRKVTSPPILDLDCDGDSGGGCNAQADTPGSDSSDRCASDDSGQHQQHSADPSRPAPLLLPLVGGGASWWLPSRPGSLKAPLGDVQRDVEWRLPVGCDFSGFFVEVVCGYIPFLLERGINVKLLHLGCSDEFIESKLNDREAVSYREAQMTDRQRAPAATKLSIAIEHAEPCNFPCPLVHIASSKLNKLADKMWH